LIFYYLSTTNPRSFRHDSSSSIDTRENSPIRAILRTTPQPQQMNYQQYTSSRLTPNYSSYSTTTTPRGNYFDNTNSINRDQRYTDSYGRSIVNPLPAIFRTATITTNSPPTPIVTAKVQQYSYRPLTSNSTYDTPRSYNETRSSGYASDTNDFRCSSISVRPMNGSHATTTNIRHVVNQQPSIIAKPSTGAEQSYYSDSEYVTSGPRYYKISRQVNTVRRPSNVVLPIRSLISKAYDQYVPTEPPKPQQQPFDVYRYQQEQQRLEREREQREQRERERQEQLQRQLYQQQQQAAAIRFNPLPKLTIPTQTPFDPEIGAELLKSPITHRKFCLILNT
jgi:hypothetical protein